MSLSEKTNTLKLTSAISILVGFTLGYFTRFYVGEPPVAHLYLSLCQHKSKKKKNLTVETRQLSHSPTHSRTHSPVQSSMSLSTTLPD